MHEPEQMSRLIPSLLRCRWRKEGHREIMPGKVICQVRYLNSLNIPGAVAQKLQRVALGILIFVERMARSQGMGIPDSVIGA